MKFALNFAACFRMIRREENRGKKGVKKLQLQKMILGVSFVCICGLVGGCSKKGEVVPESETVVNETETEECITEECTTEEIIEQTEEKTVIKGTFNDICGYAGYYITEVTNDTESRTTYYVEEDGESTVFAYSYGSKREDYIVDTDGDGINELICSVMVSEDMPWTDIYRREGSRILKGDALELLYHDFEYMSVGARYAIYRPEENIIEAYYCKDDMEDYVCKKYEIDYEKIWDWTEVYNSEEAFVDPAQFSDGILNTLEMSVGEGRMLTLQVIGKRQTDSDRFGVRQIDVYDGEKIIQQIWMKEAIDTDGVDGIEEGYTECWNVKRAVYLRDVNFDGYLDLEVYGWTPNNSIPYYYWCWNPERQQFEYAFTLQLTDIDKEKELLIEWYKVENGLYHTNYYHVTADNELELFDRVIDDFREE